jgi:Holliday junction DNA helicase RuvA
MISQISGKVIEEKNNSLFVDVGGICYEVLIPTAVIETIRELQTSDGHIRLVTYYYLQNDPSRSVPVLIGFANSLEREFFELFITVSGIGPKAAVKALALPIPSIVEAIENANYFLLQSLPGIGRQRAREIVAKLQGKVGRFGLIKETASKKADLKTSENLQREALAVLTQLQYKTKEAEEMIKKALINNPKIDSVEQILNEIYKQKKENGKN